MIRLHLLTFSFFQLLKPIHTKNDNYENNYNDNYIKARSHQEW